MDKLTKLIEETTDVRELKRALSVKLREGGAAGSRRRCGEARNTNDIEGSHPWDELAQHSKVP